MSREFRETLRRIIEYLAPWVCFWLLFAWGWRVRNVFTHIPAYGDVLEVLWGIQWYHDSIVQHSSPLFTPLLFHPTGWHTATLAHTPVMFVLSLPLYEFGGLGFAYNALAIFGVIIAFAGAYRYARRLTSLPTAIATALAFAYWNMCWGRISGHLHMAWVSGLLPWLACGLEQARYSQKQVGKWVIFTGIIWGLMINFALYGIFIGALAFFLILGFRPQKIKQSIVAGFIAVAIGLPTIVPYIWGSWQDHLHIWGVEHNMWWGASLNSLFMPSVFHPLAPIRSLSRTLYTGPYNESGVMNLGLLTALLALIGMAIVVKEKRDHLNLIGLTVSGLILSMGILLRWNGEVVSHPVFRPLDAVIWNLGRAFKPEVFPFVRPAPFESGVPLPGFFLAAVVPFWESARTVSRYALLGELGAVMLAGIALERFPKVARAFLMAIWLIEILPHPTGNVPIPFQPHPAYAWLAQQSLEQNEGIVEVAYPTLRIGGEILWATLFHRKPTASGVGSFWPTSSFSLWRALLDDREVLSRPSIGSLFGQYGIRYLFLHILGDKEREMWALVGQNPAFQPVDCFEPLPRPNPWPYPICVAEVKPMEGPIQLILQDGWSGREDWGVWSEGNVSRAGWIARIGGDYRLQMGAFPLCAPGKHQMVTIKVNGQEIAAHLWEDCELWEGEIPIPGDVVKVGWNYISFEYEYALSPAEVTQGKNPDGRRLAVGFTRLEVEP